VKRIGILNLTRLGDLVQTSPVVSGLRRRHPDAEIHLIAKSRFREAARLLPGVDRILEIDGDALARRISGADFMDAWGAVRRIADELASIEYDALYNLTHSRASAALVALMSARQRIGYGLDREGLRQVNSPWLTHMATLVSARRLSRFNLVDIYLGAAALYGSREALAVEVPAAAQRRAQELLPGEAPRLAVQLGASSDNKTWSAQACALALRALRARAPEVALVLVGVPAERRRAEALRAACPELEPLDLLGQTTVSELAAVLRRCRLLLTGDTGTMHLAAAVGTRTCAVFVGVGNPWETAPYAEDHVVLASRIACAPCQLDLECGYPACHQDFPPEFLGELLARMLRGQALDGLPRLPRADVYRTRRGTDALLDLEPLARRAPAAHELLAPVYRALFLERFERVPTSASALWREVEERHAVAREDWRNLLPDDLPARLAELSALSERALGLAGALARARRDPGELKRGADQLAACDREIAGCARAEPLLLPLGLALEAALESLPEVELDVLIDESARHYAALARGTALLSNLLGASEPVNRRGVTP
jgi:ADP-heptose:LPS heptosyltransferase